MPTGYTAAVADGKITDFPTFAMQCARAFGAPIPEEFQPSDYYAKRTAAIEAEIQDLRTLTPADAAARMQSEYSAALAAWEKRRADRNATRERYEAMLREVHAWTPPTPEHEGMKTFMIEQLTESIRFDCSHTHDHRPPRPDPRTSDWLDEKIAKAEQNLADAREQAQRENERVAGRNEWVRALRDSLAVKDGAR